jgi:NAD(P)-dependent dehydrogenase (short-subunit alcohol dehydrogenase family)
MNNKIWLITGASSGFGAALVQAVMQRGDFAIGTFRKTEQVDAFNRENAGRGLGLLMDVTQPSTIEPAFEHIKTAYGRLDVLVNNAGYGIAGAVEEAGMDEVRAIFETNVFGALQTTQLALPLMRGQRSGHIIQISSGAGFKATPGFGIYNATKFALEGFSEALADEVRPLGIRVTIVEPGPFRTQFAGGSLVEAARKIDDYDATAGVFRQRMANIDGKQEGDPEKGAEAIVQVVYSVEPPMRLPLGRIVLVNIQAKLDQVKKDLDNWRAVAENTIFTS